MIVSGCSKGTYGASRRPPPLGIPNRFERPIPCHLE